MITKQECMVLLSDLPLYICSEIIEKVSLSGDVAVTNEKKKSNTILAKYKRRPFNERDITLNQFFNNIKNRNNKRNKNQKLIIPHYTSGKTAHIFPPTEDYARSMLMIYKPWWGDNHFANTCDYTKEFYEFISSNAPHSLKMGFFHAQKVHQDRFCLETVSKPANIKNDEIEEDDQDIFC